MKTAEEKATEYAEIKDDVDSNVSLKFNKLDIFSAHLAGQQAAWEWISIPRDKDGLVEWDKLDLPKADAYICKMQGDASDPYEISLEFCSEGDFKHVIAVLPIP